MGIEQKNHGDATKNAAFLSNRVSPGPCQPWVCLHCPTHRAPLQDTEGTEVSDEVLSTLGATAHHKNCSERTGKAKGRASPGVGGQYRHHSIQSRKDQGNTGPRVSSLTFGPDGHQLDSFAGYEIQGLVDVGDLVHPHLASLWLGQAFA